MSVTPQGIRSMQRRTDAISVCVRAVVGRWGQRKNLIPSKMHWFYLIDFINLWVALTDKIALIVQSFLLPSLSLPVIGTSTGARILESPWWVSHRLAGASPVGMVQWSAPTRHLPLPSSSPALAPSAGSFWHLTMSTRHPRPPGTLASC